MLIFDKLFLSIFALFYLKLYNFYYFYFLCHFLHISFSLTLLRIVREQSRESEREKEHPKRDLSQLLEGSCKGNSESLLLPYLPMYFIPSILTQCLFIGTSTHVLFISMAKGIQFLRQCDQNSEF